MKKEKIYGEKITKQYSIVKDKDKFIVCDNIKKVCLRPAYNEKSEALNWIHQKPKAEKGLYLGRKGKKKFYSE